VGVQTKVIGAQVRKTPMSTVKARLDGLGTEFVPCEINNAGTANPTARRRIPLMEDPSAGVSDIRGPRAAARGITNMIARRAHVPEDACALVRAAPLWGLTVDS
jgi:hypothetical protein